MADMSVLIISSKGVTPTFKSIFYKVNPGLKLQFLQQLQEKGGCGKTVHDKGPNSKPNSRWQY